jgi:uncharacterized protein (UPF0335 family)
MLITFKTPDIAILHKKRNKSKNYALMLLSNFYRNMQTNIINNLESNQIINLSVYKEDLSNILKIIYQHIFLEYPYIIDNHYINEKKKKEKITVNNADDIKRQFQNYKNDFIEELLSVRVNLIFDSFVDKLNNMWSSSRKEASDDIEKMQTRVNEITKIINANAGISISQVINRIEKLSQERVDLTRKISNSKEIVKQVFKNKYKKEIIENRSLLQAENEVNNIYNRAQIVEHQVMRNNFNNIIVNNTRTQIQQAYKRWNSFLDKRTRSTHAQADGQVVKESEKFVLYNPKTFTPEYTLSPMGEGLSLENSINCRCSVEYFYIFQVNE